MYCLCVLCALLLLVALLLLHCLADLFWHLPHEGLALRHTNR